MDPDTINCVILHIHTYKNNSLPCHLVANIVKNTAGCIKPQSILNYDEVSFCGPQESPTSGSGSTFHPDLVATARALAPASSRGPTEEPSSETLGTS